MMIITIVNILFIILISFFNSIMDTVDHHFSTSIFSKIESKFWRKWFNEKEGWRNKYVDGDVERGYIKWSIFGIEFNKPVQISDSWHFFKTLKIFSICLILSIDLTYMELFPYQFYCNDIVYVIIYWSVFGIIWNTIFNVFYNKILKK